MMIYLSGSVTKIKAQNSIDWGLQELTPIHSRVRSHDSMAPWSSAGCDRSRIQCILVNRSWAAPEVSAYQSWHQTQQFFGERQIRRYLLLAPRSGQ